MKAYKQKKKKKKKFNSIQFKNGFLLAQIDFGRSILRQTLVLNNSCAFANSFLLIEIVQIQSFVKRRQVLIVSLPLSP